jgi:hypothetical protein
MPSGRNQGEANNVFTLIISEISFQKVKVSSNSKTCDKSDLPLVLRIPRESDHAFRFIPRTDFDLDNPPLLKDCVNFTAVSGAWQLLIIDFCYV